MIRISFRVQAGWELWLAELKSGKDREDVLKGFIYAQEFVELCEEYGILAYEGYITKAQREAVEAFVTRFYQLCLDRNPDPAGWDAWLAELDAGKDRGEVLDGFIYAQEFYKLCADYGIIPNRSEQVRKNCADGEYQTPDPDIFCFTFWDPVRGCDGKTYGNSCEALRAGVKVAYQDECS